MPYLIDGHNLIAALPDIDLADENDEAELVIQLRGFAARQKTKCLVIFDGGLPGGASRLSTSSVKVEFAAGHSSADALIKGRIRRARDARNWTLVTSDRDIRDCARQQRMRQLSSEEFARQLQQRSWEQVQRSEPEKPAPSEADTALWLRRFGESDDGAGG